MPGARRPDADETSGADAGIERKGFVNLLGTPAEYDQRAEALQSIRDSVGVLAPKGADLQRIRKLRFTQTGFGRDAFSLMGEMGWIALLVAEDRGGVGLGLGELCAVC